ncbi:MAG: acyl-CoA thioesterase [Gammaproteobacteria bacterium]|nr:acyl-CoA thioesterase [Gammaproteobacteria bacterium]MAY03262.1 acyl-CoA thioesterase [Gammaproteobacteria bacterium]|tara:strand:+ start:1023 stop:1436 length:414 start_codon:yes stop_codon:yes gene_type:complete
MIAEHENLDLDPNPHPDGELAIQTIALPSDTNQDGDIHGGWLACQMDMAAHLACSKVARGKVATVAIEHISFLSPISIGSVVGCYTKIKGVGRSSTRVFVEAWVSHVVKGEEWTKVAEGLFVFVAIDDNGRTRAIPK